jgi:hypothetical protein
VKSTGIYLGQDICDFSARIEFSAMADCSMSEHVTHLKSERVRNFISIMEMCQVEPLNFSSQILLVCEFSVSHGGNAVNSFILIF